MLKFMMYILFLIPCCFVIEFNWFLVQNLVTIYMFGMIINIVLGLNYEYLGYGFGMDSMSYGLNLLSVWISFLMILASIKVMEKKFFSNLFLFFILMLMFLLICTFSSMSLMYFYIFFESSLIPTLFLILGWGYQPERIQAGIYLLFYTLFASLPLLIGLMYMLNCNSSLNISNYNGSEVLNYFMYLSLIGAFLVKMPMFLVHLWLPKAHVEAPISGSMILAGVLLKLGGYGLLRLFKFMIYMGMKFNFIFISISLVGGIIVSILCLRQVDLKILIAYSSVAHMSMVLSGMMTLNSWGMYSGYLMMISHGLCSSGLFCLSNISYERLNSRSMLINKGLMNLMPSMSLWWFLLCSSNMSAPPSLNLLAEIGLMNSIMAYNTSFMFILMMLSFFSACYSLYLYSYSQHGKFYSGVFSMMNGFFREYMLLFLHWFPLNIFILKSENFMIWF